MDTVVVSVRLDRTLVDALDRTGRERSDVVRDALQEWLRRRMVAEMVREDEEAYRRVPQSAEENEWLEYSVREFERWHDEETKREIAAAKKSLRKKPASKRRRRVR